MSAKDEPDRGRVFGGRTIVMGDHRAIGKIIEPRLETPLPACAGFDPRHVQHAIERRRIQAPIQV